MVGGFPSSAGPRIRGPGRPVAGVSGGIVAHMDRPPPDPRKLLEYWMEWERGETPPGRTLANLKTHGLRELLERWAAEAGDRPVSR